MDKPTAHHAPSTPAPRPPGRNLRDAHDSHDEKPSAPPAEDGLLKVLHTVIRLAVRLLAILMTLLILWGVADVIFVMTQRMMANPYMLLNFSDILAIFGSFMTVLIAIEIFTNITLYIRRDALPIKMVIATALMAVARKVIMMDFKEIDPNQIYGIAAITLALGLTYWLISYKPKTTPQPEERER